LFKLYGEQLGWGSLPVAVSGNSPQPPPKYPVGGDQPRTNSGSPTYPLDMVAALTADRKYLTFSVVNATDSILRLELNVTGARLMGKPILWQMTGKDLDATNRVGQAPQVTVKETVSEAVPNSLSVAPVSINVFRIPLAGGAQ